MHSQNPVISTQINEFVPEYAQPERSEGHIAHIRAPARPGGGALHFVCAMIPPRASADWGDQMKMVLSRIGVNKLATENKIIFR